ncbi:hypothetical protein PMM47T1_17195 [Pseudomonas sp. M47T1]|uniref:phospholipase effector Tle1 domain-containing protein n=1 Tax=unclassified Pseudomonas TaxID=196821 RepID=UPI0002608C3A|nr:DUF2235 domain-containing protein [Pseudomonas sp. M47T1]EIK95252.1 hypothetical protein PMM47T1_17195 [Pseudomonas sp. M47T1]
MTTPRDTLRIGVFFDGTGNHAENAPLDDAELFARGGSHATALTNIVKLCRLYDAPGRSVKSIYVPGMGTEAGARDRLLGSALGRGRTGVLARVEQALCEIRQAAAGKPAVVDLFGFSRGGAAARHCANQVAGLPGLSVGFVGLFDTVVAVAGRVELDLHLDPARFPEVVHLVARDEQREHFALAQVSAEHLEIELPGAHSDIGGGYPERLREQLLVGRMQALVVPKGMAVESTSIYREAAHLKRQWLARGWLEPWLTILTPEATAVVDRSLPPSQQVYAALQLEREVRGELSRVYLRVMHEMASAHGVPLLPVPDTGEYALPAELAPLCKRFMGADTRLDAKEELLLRLGYIHVSAHWTAPAALQGSAPRLGASALYINAPTADGERIRYRY